jgi:hypothetical protein
VLELRPQILALSISHVQDLKSCAARCSELFVVAQKSGCALAIGGRALTREVRQVLSADFFGGSLGELDEYARSLKPRHK